MFQKHNKNIVYISCLVLSILNTVSSFEMIKVDRYLEKDGLHRTFVNDLTYKIEN